MGPTRSHRHGFTLIELLVVIAIIVILAAILFPVFSRARESGRKTVCVANLHQIGIAFQMYTQVWNDGLPLYRFDDVTKPYDEWGWPEKIRPFTRNKKLIGCPSRFRPNDWEEGGRIGFSLAYPYPGGRLTKVSNYDNQARSVLVMDAWSKYPPAVSDACYWHVSAPWTKDYDYIATPEFRHSGRADVLYVDGHVKSNTREEIYLNTPEVNLKWKPKANSPQ